MPRPTPAQRSDLRPAFNKSVPATLADLRSMEQQVKALAARLSPTVVAVEVGSGSGSGVIISADGLVLTAGHVCGAPDRDVRFTFPDGKTARGKTVGVNLDNDTGPDEDHRPWPLAPRADGRSRSRLASATGCWRWAIPAALICGARWSCASGALSGSTPMRSKPIAPSAPGDSGGPLFDMHGRVIGIHSAISSSVAENFHVAVTAFYDSWAQLVQSPSPTEQADKPLAYVGARGRDDPSGCRLTAVDEAGPAAKAGLKVGDLVVKVDGREIPLYASFLRWVAEAEPGETLNLEVKRGDRLLSLEVKLEPSPTKRP